MTPAIHNNEKIISSSSAASSSLRWLNVFQPSSHPLQEEESLVALGTDYREGLIVHTALVQYARELLFSLRFERQDNKHNVLA